MTLDKIINDLQKLSDEGYGTMEVKLLCCNDNPLSGEGIEVNGVYVIAHHYEKDVNGVYIDGTA